MADVTLTEDEREALSKAISHRGHRAMYEATEAIVAARVAAVLGEVEARLVDELAPPFSHHDPLIGGIDDEIADALRIVREVRGEVGG